MRIIRCAHDEMELVILRGKSKTLQKEVIDEDLKVCIYTRNMQWHVTNEDW